ncbi:hypothetical protein ACODT5_40985 [Streptomyces sp. 5.8]|uniref:ATP-binding protein n=1 Tax=Streptomyces sp. 5.8 TaxID=3406571 RepID=UPI003BB6DDF2
MLPDNPHSPCTAEKALEAAGSIGYPVVLKPRGMGAGIGVVLAADAAEVWATLTEWTAR